MTGLVRVMGKCGRARFLDYFLPRILFPMNGSHLIGQGNSLASREWPCTGLWFVGLSWAVSLGHGKFSETTLLRMEHLQA